MSTTQSLPKTPPLDTLVSGSPLLTRASGSTLAEQLADRFAQRIEQRLLAAGARLPSVRDCARRHQVSTSTVVGAYDLLQARGLVQARPQRGFFVRDMQDSRDGREGRAHVERNGDLARQRLRALGSVGSAEASSGEANGAENGAAINNDETNPSWHNTFAASRATLQAPIDATALIRGMFQAQGSLNSPGMGTLPESWLDAGLLQRALRKVCAEPESWLRYGDPAGDQRLRHALCSRMADLGIEATPAHLVTTVGATHGLDLVSRTLLQAGDCVLVDEPGWAVEYARLSRQGMRLLPVPRGEQGPDLEVLAAMLREHQPRLYVTVSVLHNPTGHSISPAAAHQVLQLAEKHDLTIVEDDTYAWLAPDHSTRMAQLDGLRRTVYISGFSKILTPQWRVGFVAAAPALAQRLIDTKLLSTLSSPGVLEQAIALCLEQGLLRRHAERVVARLNTARARTVRLAEEAGCRWVSPPAGLFGWLDVGTDTEMLAQSLLDSGWLTAPGTLFHAAPRPTSLMRVNFATAQDPLFWQQLKLLRQHVTPKP